MSNHLLLINNSGYKADIFGVAAIVLEMLVSQKYYVNSWISIYDDHNRSESTIFEAAMKTGIRKALLEVQVLLYHYCFSLNS